MNENDQTFTPDFSDVPALGDTQGLENYLNNAALASQGLPTDTQPAATTVQQEQSVQPTATTQTTPAQPAGPAITPQTQQFTPEQLAEIANRVAAIQAQTGVQQKVPQVTTGGYTQQEQAFINAALRRGYNLAQINQTIMQNRAKNGVVTPQSNAMEQRITEIEQFLRSQQYLQAQNAFIAKANSFASKWGLSDADLETFANEALKHGINIADEKVDMEMVFRAVYPQQYAIRSQRMTPTNASQIYGGTSIPEGNRANASKIEDQYVEAFLKGTMPNQYAASNKK